MNLSEEQFSEVEEMAGLFFSPEEIAVNLELDEDDTDEFIGGVICKRTPDKIVAVYMRGRLSAEVTIRKAIKQSALNGSSPSQQMMMNYEKESRK